jgi:hypothetical protein
VKRLRKIFLYSLVALLVVIAGLTASVFIFKDRILQQFIREANKHLGTPVRIANIEISALSEFPQLTIELTDVYVEDSHPGEYPLLTAKKVSFLFNPLEVWRGNYTIRGLQVNDSETNLRINKAGVNNYTVIKKGDGNGSVSFNLRNVALRNTLVTYIDQAGNLHHEFSSASLVATIVAKGNQYAIDTKGDLVTEQIGIGSAVWFQKKAFDATVQLLYDDKLKVLDIKPSTLSLHGADFEVSGTYRFKDKNLIDLHTVGQNANIQLLFSLLPAASVSHLQKYQSKGDVYFDMKLKGELSSTHKPGLEVRFGMKDATVFHPDYQSRIENATVEGLFTTPSLAHTHDAFLSLKNIKASLNGDAFTGNFEMKNFDDPYVTADFSGEVNADALLNFYRFEDLHELTGRINADVSLRGRIALLKNKATAQQVHTEGNIELHDINFRIGENQHAFTGMNGALQFDNNDLAMSNLKGSFENSDFVLNGFFKNVVTFLLFPNQPIGVEADLKSDFLDIDQLFSIGFGSQDQGPYQFNISPNLHLNFTYNVKQLRFRRFHPTRVKGDLLVKGQVAVARGIHLTGMGGTVDLSGIIDAKNPKAIDLIASSKLKGIQIDSLFYVFEDFQQDFINYKNLRGQADADIALETTLTSGLSIVPETLIADVSATIRQGELNNFAPMQNLNKYLDDEGLSRLRFGELKNDIHIEKKTVYIPQMEVRSNLTTIQISGTHTFDQHINYRVVAPLRTRKKIDPDEAFGAIEQDNKGQSRLFLKIIGTTEDYEVTYDKEAVKKKIASDLKKEVQELKDAFKLKGQKKKKELELKKDEYFDWEN